MSESPSRLLGSRSIRELSTVRPWRNLVWLAQDYLVGFAVIGAALWLHFRWDDFGWHWAFQIPLWAIAVFLIGAVQHRIGLMGHEASHYMLVPGRKWNDVLAQLLCFFPLFASVVQYRARHLPHHHHPNDPERDPNLGNGKADRLYGRFPMPKRAFVCHYYLKLFWPPFVLANLLDLFRVVTIGSGMAPVSRKKNGAGSRAALLGLGYVILLFFTLLCCRLLDWPLLVPVGSLYLSAVGIWAFLPDSFFGGNSGLSIPVRLNAWMRFTWYTILFTLLLFILRRTGWDPTPAFLALWIFPLIYVFPYLMLLREICQHANAGTGALDNSRIIHVDPFSRWAVFGYGNDLHLVHHLYPVIPHDRLRLAHERLRSESESYRAGVEETRGTYYPQKGGESLSLLASLAAPGPAPHHPPAPVDDAGSPKPSAG